MSKGRWLKDGMERARDEQQNWPGWMRTSGSAERENIMGKKVTSKRAATASSKVLRSKATGRKSKTAAGSALSQREKAHRRTTRKKK